jgi:hypothetical protein
MMSVVTMGLPAAIASNSEIERPSGHMGMHHVEAPMATDAIQLIQKEHILYGADRSAPVACVDDLGSAPGELGHSAGVGGAQHRHLATDLDQLLD